MGGGGAGAKALYQGIAADREHTGGGGKALMVIETRPDTLT